MDEHPFISGKRKSANAIKIQILVILIANLLLMITQIGLKNL